MEEIWWGCSLCFNEQDITEPSSERINNIFGLKTSCTEMPLSSGCQGNSWKPLKVSSVTLKDHTRWVGASFYPHVAGGRVWVAPQLCMQRTMTHGVGTRERERGNAPQTPRPTELSLFTALIVDRANGALVPTEAVSLWLLCNVH